ncbi:M20 aminoacylase family protein [Cupriavidus sp. 8B]
MPAQIGIVPEIHAAAPAFVALRRDIHAHPELGHEEFRTSKLVADRLREWGYAVTEGIGGTGVVGQLSVGEGSRRIGIRADMDALPISETTGLPYASTFPGKMHACGHDGHTAILLSAAYYLANTRGFSGTLNLIFQPAEEGLGGAARMIEDGLFDRYPCDAIFALHNGPGLPVGHFAVREGAMAASSDSVSITLTGKGTHGAMPNFGRDPIVAAAGIVMALQTIVSRNLPATEAGVITVGALQAGSAHNVIPDTAQILLTVRSQDREVRDAMERRLRELVDLQARSFGVSAEIEYTNVSRVLVNTPAETRLMRSVLEELVGADHVVEPPKGIMGSEDFSWMLEQLPGCYVVLGNGAGSQGGCMVHNPGYDFNDEALSLGASLWARLVERYLIADASREA